MVYTDEAEYRRAFDTGVSLVCVLARSRCSEDVLDVPERGVDGCQSAGAKCVGGLTSLITSEVNAVRPDRESDVRVEIVRLHGEKVLAGHGAEVDRGNHDLLPSALRSPGHRLLVGVMRCWSRDTWLSQFDLGRALQQSRSPSPLIHA